MNYTILEKRNEVLYRKLIKLEKENERLLKKINRILHPSLMDRYAVKGKKGKFVDYGFIYAPYVPLMFTENVGESLEEIKNEP